MTAPATAGLIERLRAIGEGREFRIAHIYKAAYEAADALAASEADVATLRNKLNAPELHDFAQAVVLEAAHQRERWGNEHDEGKTAEDWMWLIAYLSTKATQANRYGDVEKYLHHIITCAAACNNWHASASGANNEMRAGAHVSIAELANDAALTKEPQA